ncbi:MAG TPA: hypothetical protein VGS97_04270 [Actinocrinis sp.]|uniref:ParB/RepB/Spo0J family partition protein n=1 Tax=Actinocrinis sp. TaxID=1920516 RepID=UPI002DDD114B|nr:hypothetical protein [Actinocrinis sp.]HEV2343285.1 hypothetical protein [Actinocrinis sp.]
MNSNVVPHPSSNLLPLRATHRPRHTSPGASAVLPLEALLPADSPRLAGPDPQHVRLLADTAQALPPVLVHRTTMRIIDGMHRLLAARLRGEADIAVEYFDGSADDAFVRGVRANVTHGLPLSRLDREVAAARIIGSHRQWSDRALADAVGLSAPTVAAIRRRLSGSEPAMEVRLGRDGRSRPLSTAEGRLKASRILDERPDASLRQIAREAGISVGTARDVKKRLNRGEDPVPARVPARRAAAHPPDTGTASLAPTAEALASRTVQFDVAALLHILRRDPSLRFTNVGRALLQWLSVQELDPDGRLDLVRSVPPHCRTSVAALARNCAEVWQELAVALEHEPQAVA